MKYSFKNNKDTLDGNYQSTEILIDNVCVKYNEINDIIFKMITDPNYVGHIYSNNAVDSYGKTKTPIFKRLIPDEIVSFCEGDIAEGVLDVEIDKLILKWKKINKGYYYMIAESLIIIFMHLKYGAKVINSRIDFSTDINETATGPDSCFYSQKESLLILGEAKFYSGHYEGLTAIKNSLDKIGNKVSGMKRRVESISEDNFLENSIAIKIIDSDKTIDSNFEFLDLNQFFSLEKHIMCFLLYSPKEKKWSLDNIRLKIQELLKERTIDGKSLKEMGFLSIKVIRLEIDSKDELVKLVIKKALNTYKNRII